MGYSAEWDERYRENTHLSVWPWTDLVSHVHRYAKPTAGFHRVLELGCGAGANIPFFLQLGVDYQAVEGSAAIVERLQKTYPDLKDRILIGDFTKALPDGIFDLIVDRGSLTSNATDAVRNGLKLVHRSLRPGGRFIGIDWFSTDHQDAARGTAVDAHTRRDLPSDSHLFGTGNAHFFDKDHLVDLLQIAGFHIERLEHKHSQVLIPDGAGQLAWWNFVAIRP